MRIRHRVLIVATAETRESLKISTPVGSTIPLLAGAVGKGFLAAENREYAADLITRLDLPYYIHPAIDYG